MVRIQNGKRMTKTHQSLYSVHNVHSYFFFYFTPGISLRSFSLSLSQFWTATEYLYDYLSHTSIESAPSPPLPRPKSEYAICPVPTWESVEWFKKWRGTICILYHGKKKMMVLVFRELVKICHVSWRSWWRRREKTMSFYYVYIYIYTRRGREKSLSISATRYDVWNISVSDRYCDCMLILLKGRGSFYSAVSFSASRKGFSMDKGGFGYLTEM